MELRVGGRVELTFRNTDLSAHAEPAPDKYKEYEGAGFQGRVTRCDPPRVLSYTWGEHSEVTFELSPQGDDVLLVLTHRRLPDRTAMVMVGSGWHLAILLDHLNGREPRPFWSTHARLEAEYEAAPPPDVRQGRSAQESARRGNRRSLRRCDAAAADAGLPPGPIAKLTSRGSAAEA